MSCQLQSWMTGVSGSNRRRTVPTLKRARHFPRSAPPLMLTWARAQLQVNSRFVWLGIAAPIVRQLRDKHYYATHTAPQQENISRRVEQDHGGHHRVQPSHTNPHPDPKKVSSAAPLGVIANFDADALR